MSEEMREHLLRLIRSAPGDDEARLVYADWLSDHGDPARADLIRTQVSRASLPAWDERQVSLEMTERALLAAGEAKFRADLPALEGVIWGRFRRGFVSRAAFEDIEALARHAAACQQATWLDAVALRWPDLEQWDTMPELPELRRLTLFGTLFDEDSVEGLAVLPALASVRELDLVASEMGEDAFAAMLASPHLERLEALRIPHHTLGNIDALVDGAALPSLVELDLSVPLMEEVGSGGLDSEPLDSEAAQRLAYWPGLAKVRSLNLSGNLIESEGLTDLLSSPYIGALKELHVQGIAESYLSFGAFLSANPALSLEVLSVRGSISRESARQLAQAPCLAHLRSLTLAGYPQKGALEALAEAPWLAELRVLDLSGFEALGLLRPLVERDPPHLHTLDLSGALRRSDERASLFEQLVSSPLSNRLLSLRLSFNQADEAMFDALAGAVGLGRLLSLGLVDRRKPKSKAVDKLLRSPLGARLKSFEIGPTESRLPRPNKPRIDCGPYDGPLVEL